MYILNLHQMIIFFLLMLDHETNKASYEEKRGRRAIVEG
jgi:hypothetical protein